MERRRAPRISHQVQLALSGASDAGEALSATTHNISASGVYCMLEQFIAPMTKLEVTFELPTGQKTTRITCNGVVVRVEPVVTREGRGRYHMAIFFTALTDRDRTAIAKFVERCFSRGAPTS